jgi:polyhydroxyalkanoate synthase
MSTGDDKQASSRSDMAESWQSIIDYSQRLSRVIERSQKVLGTAIEQSAGPSADPAGLGPAFIELNQALMSRPQRLWEAQIDFAQSYIDLWNRSLARWNGEQPQPLMEPAKGDRRFKNAEWSESIVFDHIKQTYLLTSSFLNNLVCDVDGLDETTQKKVEFYTRQFVDAISPSNFLFTNPEVIRATIESKGDNLIQGMENLVRDLELGEGKLKISMTDSNAFKVGENIGITPGKVVFRNELIELIQYAPTTKTVARRPLIIIPPWINKFYILDLTPQNSFIRWAVEQGQTVFVVSWKNPDSSYRDKDFQDYMFEGPLAAIGAALEQTGEDECNIIGYCIGGTLVSCMLAWMKNKGDSRVHSATFFTTLIDFDDAGDLKIFTDEEQIRNIEKQMDESGYLDGRAMATTFNMLRANDLIWSFVVNNYLLGRDPFPFDLLYWNSDTTRMPKAMHSFYLRRMYLCNDLIRPGAVTISGVPIDMSTIDLPCMSIATREDHIAPWQACFRMTSLFSGDVHFVLAGSGHIAGIINPPARGKYGYAASQQTPADPAAWDASATRHDGSWWPAWATWVAQYSGGSVPARDPSAGILPALCDAPGTFVLERS